MQEHDRLYREAFQHYLQGNLIRAQELAEQAIDAAISTQKEQYDNSSVVVSYRARILLKTIKMQSEKV